MTGDLVALSGIEKNFVERIDSLERQLAELQRRDTQVNVLSDLAVDMGELRAGRFLAGAGSPEDGNFTGTGMSAEGETFNGNIYHIYGANAGVLQWGANSNDGTLVGAAGAVVLNQLGIVRTGITYFDRWEATDSGLSRRLEIATALLSGTTLAATMTWYDSAAGTNLQVNGDFELGTLADFTSATDGGTWSADTAVPASGVYAALLQTTAYNTGSELQVNGDFELGAFTDWTTGGTGTWAVNTTNPKSGTYSAQLTTTASQTGTLTTNLGATPRMAVTAGKYYIFTVTSQRDSGTGAYSTNTMAIKWYTATSGGSLISTTSNPLLFAVGNYRTNTYAVLAPATAAGAEIVITMTRTSAASTDVLRFDDISFKLAQGGSLTTNLGGTPRMAVTAGNSYSLSYDVAVDNSLESSATAFVVKNASIKWYTATSGGSLISTDVIPFTLTYNAYVNFAATLTAPATAAGAEFVIEVVRSKSYESTSINFYLDNVVFQAVTVSQRLIFRDTGIFWDNGAGSVKLLAVSVAYIEDQKSQNTAGGTFTSGADRTRDLNTEVSDPDGIVTISSNQFTLATAGIYCIEWSAPAYRCDGHQSILYDVTGAAILKRGTSMHSTTSLTTSVPNRSDGFWRIVTTASNTFEIRHRCITTQSTNGFGVQGNTGTETYTWVKITRYG